MGVVVGKGPFEARLIDVNHARVCSYILEGPRNLPASPKRWSWFEHCGMIKQIWKAGTSRLEAEKLCNQKYLIYRYSRCRLCSPKYHRSKALGGTFG